MQKTLAACTVDSREPWIPKIIYPHKLETILLENLPYLEFFKMECGVQDPPMLDPFVALVVHYAVTKHLGQRWELELLEMAEFVGHHVPD
jgi:hypothetical protein